MTFQELLKYLNGTIVSTLFLPLAPVTPVVFCSELNEALLPRKLLAALASVKAGLSLYYYHKIPDVFE